MPQYFALKPLRLATVQIQAWQDRRNNKAVAGGNTEIGDVNESAALAAVARLQAGGLPVFNPLCNIIAVRQVNKIPWVFARGKLLPDSEK